MSLARPNGRLGRAFERHCRRLVRDSYRFTRATLAHAESGNPGLASARMEKALARWRRDTRKALRRVRKVRKGTRGKKTALEALRALDAALGFLNKSYTASDADAAAFAAQAAEQNMTAYRQLNKKLVKRLG